MRRAARGPGRRPGATGSRARAGRGPARGRSRARPPGVSALHPRQRRVEVLPRRRRSGTRRRHRSPARRRPARRCRRSARASARPAGRRRVSTSITPRTSSTGSATRRVLVRASTSRALGPTVTFRTSDSHIEVQNRHDLPSHIDRPAHARRRLRERGDGDHADDPLDRSERERPALPADVNGDQFDCHRDGLYSAVSVDVPQVPSPDRPQRPQPLDFPETGWWKSLSQHADLDVRLPRGGAASSASHACAAMARA